MRLSDLSPTFYFGTSTVLGALTFSCPHCQAVRIGVGVNGPENQSYALITETGYVRPVTPSWHNPTDPKPGHLMHNYLSTPLNPPQPVDPNTITIQPVIDATNHGHGTFSITNGDVI